MKLWISDFAPKLASLAVGAAVLHGFALLFVRPQPLLRQFYTFEELEAHPSLVSSPDLAALLPVVVESLGALLLASLAFLLVFRNSTPGTHAKLFVALCLSYVLAFTMVVDTWRTLVPASGAVSLLPIVVDAVSLVVFIWALSAFVLQYPQTLGPEQIILPAAAQPASRIKRAWAAVWSRVVRAWLRREVRAAGFTLLGLSYLLVDSTGIPADLEITAETVFVLVVLSILMVCFYLLRVQYVRADSENRLRTLWIALAFYLWLTLGIGASFVSEFMPAGSREAATIYWLVNSLSTLALALCFTVGIFVHGAVERSLALRRTTIYTSFGFIMVGLFVLAESGFSQLIEHWLRIPALDRFTGVLAGGTVTAVMNPCRNLVERWVNQLIDRLVPADVYAHGKKVALVVVYADLAGYSAATQANAAAAITTRTLFQRTAATVAPRHHGRVANALSDAVVMHFDNVDSALRASTEIQLRYAAAARALDVVVLQVRTGIHRGEVSVGMRGELIGPVVNLATRLEAAAEAGEILVSQEAAGQANELFDRLELLQPRSVPGLAGTTACYRYSPDHGAVSA